MTAVVIQYPLSHGTGGSVPGESTHGEYTIFSLSAATAAVIVVVATSMQSAVARFTPFTPGSELHRYTFALNDASPVYVHWI